MESSRSKRRKTSSTPLARPNGQPAHGRAMPHSGDSSYSMSASFMSPTKASLARFHPSLLPATSPARARRPGSGGDGQQPSLNGTMSRRVLTDARARSAEPITTSKGTAPSSGLMLNSKRSLEALQWQSRTPERPRASPQEAMNTAIGEIRASPPEESRNRDHEAEQYESAGIEPEVTQDMAAFPVANKSQERVLDPVPRLPSTPSRIGTNRSRLGMGQGEDGEPSLPPTPIHLGIEQPPEPAQGLLFSSPSLGRKRRRQTSPKSSPLKPRATDPMHLSQRSGTSSRGLGSQVYIVNTPRPPPSAQDISLLDSKKKLAELEKQLQEIEIKLLHRLIISRWQVVDGKESKETSRLKKAAIANSSRVVRSRRDLNHARSASITSRDMITEEYSSEGFADGRRAEGANADCCQEGPRPPILSQHLTRFLPFSEKVIPPLPRAPVEKVDISKVLDLDTQNGSDALFEISISSVCLLDELMSSDALLQRQNICLTSQPRSLDCRVETTVSTDSQDVMQLEVLEMSPWAEKEFGSWLRMLSKGSSLAAIGSAFGLYWMTCMKRLQCWRLVSRDFNDLVATSVRSGETSLSAEDAELSSFISCLGRQDMRLARDDVTLDFNWRISISECGDIVSETSASVDYPLAWRQIGIGTELAKVKEAFDLLVRERETAQAMLVISNSIFSS